MIDTSALMAVILIEHDASRYLDAIVSARRRAMSVANWLEATIVVGRKGHATASIRLDEFLRDARIELVPVSVAQAETARQAWQRFGRPPHRAELNFGDCYAYALSKEMRELLLFKGGDFVQTAIEPTLKD